MLILATAVLLSWTLIVAVYRKLVWFERRGDISARDLALYSASRAANGCVATAHQGLEKPGSLDVVISYYNSTPDVPADPRPLNPRSDNLCGFTIAGCECISSRPCCRGFVLGDAGGGGFSENGINYTAGVAASTGVCGIGPEYCGCEDCLDSRVVSPERTGLEIKWLLRGVDAYMGVVSAAKPTGVVRRIYIAYNSLAGNGPPTFIKWKVDHSRSVPKGCHDKVYVAHGSGNALIAVPHCYFFPPDGDAPGKSRNAAQMPVHRIPGLSEYFWYMEDDMTAIRPFRLERWLDMASGKIKVHVDYWLGFASNDPWHLAQRHSIDLLASRFGSRTRYTEGTHSPILVKKCLMEEVESIWNAEFAYTVGRGSIEEEANKNAAQESGDLQFNTIVQNYAVDRNAAVDAGFDPMAILNLHTHNPFVNGFGGEGLEERLCEAVGWVDGGDGVDFINIQGPGWSDEYLGVGRSGATNTLTTHLPRADIRLRLLGFFHAMLPNAAPWENEEMAAAEDDLPWAPFSQEACARFNSVWRARWWWRRVLPNWLAMGNVVFYSTVSRAPIAELFALATLGRCYHRYRRGRAICANSSSGGRVCADRLRKIFSASTSATSISHKAP
jgi:hypothetical protein